MTHAILIMLTLAACFGIQSLALRAVGGRTAKSESNYFSSLGRIQAGAVGKPEAMLLGSSITGRLPDRAQGFEGFANMGCDGGCAVDTLRAMDRGLLPVAPILLIEANTLQRALDPIPSQVGSAMKRPWFQAGMRIPAISAYARPSAFLYSILLAKKIGGFGDPESADDLRVSSHPVRLTALSATNISPNEQALVGELVPLLQRLQEKGCRIVFVWLPPGRGANSPVPPYIAAMVGQSGCEWWDLGTEADPSLVVLTDGVHMAAPSAARTSRSLKRIFSLPGNTPKDLPESP
ncbi:hypothetical protein [Luteolibacter soli]|uniref:SGNH/GDSL hydrolase family protein n=1 Tax=Luteolibacter soli TaxID=3135280 RepID=A0ABU9AW28_9BACT